MIAWNQIGDWLALIISIDINVRSVPWSNVLFPHLHNSNEIRLRHMVSKENWKYLGNNFDWSRPNTCLGRLLNITNPPTNDIHIEHPNQEAYENRCETSPIFLYNVGFLLKLKSKLIISPEYIIETATQITLVNPSALKRINCRFGKKNPPGRWISWVCFSTIFTVTSKCNFSVNLIKWVYL